MRFWFRELTGWILILLGLLVFFICVAVLLTSHPKILESGPMAFIGFVIFRGGIHLLKVAVAARVVLHGQREMMRQQLADKSRATAVAGPKPALPLEW